MKVNVGGDNNQLVAEVTGEAELNLYKKLVAEEYSTTADKVHILPYKPPSDYPDPTPFRLHVEDLFREWAEEKGVPVEDIDGTIYTRYSTYRNPFKEEEYWQMTHRSS